MGNGLSTSLIILHAELYTTPSQHVREREAKLCLYHFPHDVQYQGRDKIAQLDPFSFPHHTVQQVVKKEKNTRRL